MRTRFMMIALGCAALAATPALAQHGRDGGGGPPASMGDMGANARADARVNSQGPQNAADRGIERANRNSVLSNAMTQGVRGDRDDRNRMRDRDRDDRNQMRDRDRDRDREGVRGDRRDRADRMRRNDRAERNEGVRDNRHGVAMRTMARMHSRGRLHASARARARANANSALSTSTTTTVRHRRHRG